MSANQPDPNPFSREGSEPGDGLGSEPNRFKTWADGSTPVGPSAPNYSPTDGPASTDQPATPADPPPATAPTRYPTEPSSPSFPTYGSAPSSGYSDPEPNDEAYAAFRGYQQSTQNYPSRGIQPYQDYPSYPGYPQPGAYGSPYGPFHPRTPNSPYAVPSLVLGIIGVFCAITGPVGLGLGIAAIRQIDAEPERYRGRGLAIGGIVTGAIGTLWMLVYILAALA